MAKRDNEPGSGPVYDRVMKLIAATDQFKALKDRAVRRAHSVRVGSPHETSAWRNDANGHPAAILRIMSGHDEELLSMDVTEETNRSSFNVWSYGQLLCSKEELEAVVRATFDVTKPGCQKKKIVPAHSLKLEKVLERFHKDAMDELRALTSDIISSEVRSAVTAECLRQFASDEAVELKQTAFDDLVVKELKAVLVKYSGARPDVLKRALDEFVCHEICSALRSRPQAT